MRLSFSKILIVSTFIFGVIGQLNAQDSVRTIRAGFFDLEGYHDTNVSGRRTGYGYDFLSLVQRYENVKVEYVRGETWSELLDMLRHGEVDLLTSVHKTPERAREFGYSYPMGENHIILNIRHDDNRYKPYDFRSYSGMTIGPLEGSSINDELKRFAAENGFSFNARFFSKLKTLEQALQEGEVDAIATSSLRRTYHEKNLASFNSKYFYTIVQKHDTALLNAINSAIVQMNHYEGDWTSLLYYRNFINNGDLERIFTDKEQEYIQAHSSPEHPVIVATDNQWKPFSYMDEGEMRGILPDYWQEIIGITGLNFVYKEYDSQTPALEAVRRGEADIYLGSCMNDFEAEAENLQVSPEYFRLGASMVFCKSRSDIQTIALCDVTPALNAKFELQQGQKTVHYPNSDDAIDDLRHGTIDAILCYTFDAERIVNNDHDGTMIYRSIPGINVSIKTVTSLFRDHRLNSIVSKCINTIRGTQTEAIVARNLALTAESFRLRDWAMVHPGWSVFLAVCLLALVIALIELIIRLRYRATLNRHQGEQLMQIQSLNAQLKENHERLRLALKEQDERNKELQAARDIIANTGYGIWRIGLNKQGRNTMEANDTLQRIFGIEAMNLSPEELYTYYHGRLIDDVSEIEQDDYADMQAGSIRSRELVWQHPTKGNIYLHAGGTQYLQPDGKCIISGFCADITQSRLQILKLNQELKLVTKQAQEANKAKTEFLFNMSHDIRTPMNAIIGFTHLMSQHIDNPAKCQDYLHKIQISSDFLLSLINDVLTMARIESGKTMVEESFFIPSKVIGSITPIYEEMMAQKGLKFNVYHRIKTPAIWCDQLKAKEILLNLVSNAYKYTPSGGEVTVILEDEPSDREGYVNIITRVSDNGIGMSKEFLPKIFDEFSREHNSTENKIQGTGLGMPIVKHLVELMGGTITVESELGKGTTFVVNIPHRIAHEADMEQPQSIDIEQVNFSGKRILLVEDNDLNAEIATEILSNVGFAVEHAEDGLRALEMMEQAPARYYDLVLMDVQMPRMNGYEASRAIRALTDKEKAVIPIVAMTANAFEEDKKTAKEAGMNGHLAKPIDVNELLTTLAFILKY